LIVNSLRGRCNSRADLLGARLIGVRRLVEISVARFDAVSGGQAFQFIEQRLGTHQVDGMEALGEPVKQRKSETQI
jgi:hypothetical protein